MLLLIISRNLIRLNYIYAKIAITIYAITMLKASAASYWPHWLTELVSKTFQQGVESLKEDKRLHCQTLTELLSDTYTVRHFDQNTYFDERNFSGLNTCMYFLSHALL